MVMTKLFFYAFDCIQFYLQFQTVLYFFSYRCKRFAAVVSSILFGCLCTVTKLAILPVILFCCLFLYYAILEKIKPPYTFVVVTAHCFLYCCVSNVLLLPSLLFHPPGAISSAYLMRMAGTIVYVALYLAIRWSRLYTGDQLWDKNMIALVLSLMAISILGYGVGNAVLELTAVPLNLQVIGCLLIALLQAVVAIVVVTITRQAEERVILEHSRQYSRALERSLASLQGFRHDFHNIVNTLSGYDQLKRYDKLGEYITALKAEAVSLKTNDIIYARLKQMPFLCGVMLSAMSMACDGGIDFQVEITARSFVVRTVGEMELSRIVGNILDNALEAAADCPQKKHIQLLISNRDGYLQLNLLNTCREGPDMDRVGQRGYSGKRGHSGIGLNQSMRMISHCKGRGPYPRMTYAARAGEFEVELVV